MSDDSPVPCAPRLMNQIGWNEAPDHRPLGTGDDEKLANTTFK